MKKKAIAPLVFALALSLCACGHHEKQPSTLALTGIPEAEHVYDDTGSHVGVRIDGETYTHEWGVTVPLFRPEYGADVASPGEVVAWETVDYFYVYYARIDGMPGWIVRADDDGSGKITRSNVEGVYRAEWAETPEWLTAYRDYMESKYPTDPASGSNLK